MWQRWDNRQAQPSIGYPTHFTLLDQDEDEGHYLETILEVDSICSRQTSRRQSTAVLPDLPFRIVPPVTETAYSRQSRSEPSSAITTEPQLRLNTRVQNKYSDEVSPVTPSGYREGVEENSVSPIEPTSYGQAYRPQTERSFSSQIPRKAWGKNGQTTKEQTKWDEYSGEPTDGSNGRPATVRPGLQPLEMQYPQLKERTKQILAGLRDKETTNRSAWSQPPLPPPELVESHPLDNPPYREPWKGASGRSAIVEPVRNNPAARQEPLRPRQPNTSQMNAYHDVTVNRPPQSVHHSVLAGPPSGLTASESQESIKPVVPLKATKRKPSLGSPVKNGDVHPALRTPSAPQAALDSPFHTPYQDMYTEREIIADQEEPRNDSPHYDDEPRTPSTPVQQNPFNDLDKTPEYTPSQHEQMMESERSRFSWTTYTSTNVDSPRSLAQVVHDDDSPPPPMPALPSSIIVRKTPVADTSIVGTSTYLDPDTPRSATSTVSRKPLPSSTIAASTNNQFSTSTASRASSTAKSLPPIPAELEAADKIANLEAQIHALERRKHNISRIIHDLKQSLVKNAVTYDMWKRKEVAKNIANQKMQLDDVHNDIHELNLILHRAQRKRDKEANYEQPTGLWIKRVTS